LILSSWSWIIPKTLKMVSAASLT